MVLILRLMVSLSEPIFLLKSDLVFQKDFLVIMYKIIPYIKVFSLRFIVIH